MPFEWTEMTFLQVEAGNVAMLVFALGAVLVYLVLAAKYESWTLPLAVILVVPMCMLAAVTGMAIAGLPIDIFVQIGSPGAGRPGEQERHPDRGICPRFTQCRAKSCTRSPSKRPDPLPADHHDLAGVHLRRLAAGDRERCRRGMRRSLGTAVFTGMIGVTLFGIFLTPVFYFILMWLGPKREKN